MSNEKFPLLDFNRSKSSRWPQLMLLGRSVSIRKLFSSKKIGIQPRKWVIESESRY